MIKIKTKSYRYLSLAILMLTFYGCYFSAASSSETEKLTDKNNGFRPYYLNDKLKYEYLDSIYKNALPPTASTWTRTVMAMEMTEIRDTNYMIFNIKDSGDVNQENSDSLGKGYKKHYSLPPGLGVPDHCDIESWYPGDNNWKPGLGKLVRVGSSSFKIHKDSCIYRLQGTLSKYYYKHIIVYEDSSMGLIFKETQYSHSMGSFYLKREIGLKEKNKREVMYAKVVDAYEATK